MGTIVAEVDQGHLVKHPKERVLLQPFLENFDVTWARRRRAFGSVLSVYFLKPARHMEKAFGFEAEILAIYSGYSELQPRTVQAIEQFLSDEPARGRVDTMVTFLISEAANPVSWVRQHMTSNPESRLVCAFSAEQLREWAQDKSPWACTLHAFWSIIPTRPVRPSLACQQ